MTLRHELACAVRLARRELRGGVHGFRVFLACLVLGVGAIAAIGSLDSAVTASLVADARSLLGGDVAAKLVFRPVDPDQRAFLNGSGTVSEVATARAMARSLDGAKRTLVELKAVDGAYPLYGALRLQGGEHLAAALARRDGAFGAVADAAVASRLGLALGDRFKIGEGEVELRGLIEREPDAAFSGLMFGPRVMIGIDGLPQTGFTRPGTLISYDYRLRLAPDSEPARWAASARAAFPEAGWQIRDAADSSPSLQRLIGRIAFFLDLASITALLVGGIGIGNAVAGYLSGKTATIATLKSLGAPNRVIFSTYLIQVLALAFVGIAAGVLLGALAPAVVGPLLSGLLPIALRPGIYPAALGLAALYGILATLAFALLPLAAIRGVSPGALFRDTVAPARRRLPLAAAVATAAAALGLAALVVLTAPDRKVALWYIVGALAAFALFRGAGLVVVAAARRIGRRRLRWPLLRLALANLHRPGAPSARIVMSLGLGLSVLVTVALVQGNLVGEIDTRLAERAPGYFFIDIQPDQLAGFGETVRATPDASFDRMPMLRGRITRLNGVPVEQAVVAADAQWAIRNDRGLTYAALPPTGSHIVAGEWWPADYTGPPLISFDAELARGMGLKIGDTLTVNLLGAEIEARIANFRQIDWARLGINFAIVFAPGTLETAPQTHLAAVYLPRDREDALVRQVTDRFPNISAIPVREALAQVSRVVEAVGAAIRIVSITTLIAGILVLGGAIAAGHRRRVYDAVVLKVLGATRRAVALAFLAEYGLLGIAAALVSAGFGTLAAYWLVVGALRAQWVFLPLPLLWTLLLAVLLTLGLGFVGTWRALGVKPAPLLRNE